MAVTRMTTGRTSDNDQHHTGDLGVRPGGRLMCARTFIDLPGRSFQREGCFAKVIITGPAGEFGTRDGSTVITIEVGESDREAGGLAPESLQAALSALRTDGVVVLADVVDLDHLDALHERMLSDLALLQARPDA